MSRLKEPNFFSDDAMYARGWSWYSSLFSRSGDVLLRGESSTHYTKFPDYPRTVERLARDLPDVKLIYVMRHPIERLISQYVHEQTVGRIRTSIQKALERHDELVNYSRYAMQLAPYVETFGFSRILPVFFSRLTEHSQAELERIGRFLDYPGVMQWDAMLRPQNVGAERLRRDPLRQAIVQAPVLSTLRQKIVPRTWSQSLKEALRAQITPPVLPADVAAGLREIFDADLAQLGARLGIALDCDNFQSVSLAQPHDWIDSSYR